VLPEVTVARELLEIMLPVSCNDVNGDRSLPGNLRWMLSGNSENAGEARLRL